MIKRMKACLQCGTFFEKPYTESVKAWENRHRFCTKNCNAIYHAHHPSKVSTRFKPGHISRTAAKKGEHRGKSTEFKKGMKPWNFGLKSLTPAWNKGIAHEKVRGENHWNWKGGVTKLRAQVRGSLEYKLWRKSILDRDNVQCVLCGSTDKVCVDHIKPFSEIMRENSIATLEQALLCNEFFDLSNGRTLCGRCHEETETYFRKQHIRLSNKSMYGKKAKSSTGAKRGGKAGGKRGCYS